MEQKQIDNALDALAATYTAAISPILAEIPFDNLEKFAQEFATPRIRNVFEEKMKAETARTGKPEPEAAGAVLARMKQTYEKLPEIVDGIKSRNPNSELARINALNALNTGSGFKTSVREIVRYALGMKPKPIERIELPSLLAEPKVNTRLGRLADIFSRCAEKVVFTGVEEMNPHHLADTELNKDAFSREVAFPAIVRTFGRKLEAEAVITLEQNSEMAKTVLAGMEESFEELEVVTNARRVAYALFETEPGAKPFFDDWSSLTESADVELPIESVLPYVDKESKKYLRTLLESGKERPKASIAKMEASFENRIMGLAHVFSRCAKMVMGADIDKEFDLLRVRPKICEVFEKELEAETARTGKRGSEAAEAVLARMEESFDKLPDAVRTKQSQSAGHDHEYKLRSPWSVLTDQSGIRLPIENVLPYVDKKNREHLRTLLEGGKEFPKASPDASGFFNEVAKAFEEYESKEASPDVGGQEKETKTARDASGFPDENMGIQELLDKAFEKYGSKLSNQPAYDKFVNGLLNLKPGVDSRGLDEIRAAGDPRRYANEACAAIDWERYSNGLRGLAAKAIENAFGIKLDDDFGRDFAERETSAIINRVKDFPFRLKPATEIPDELARTAIEFENRPAAGERRQELLADLSNIYIPPETIAKHIDRSKTDPKAAESFEKAADVAAYSHTNFAALGESWSDLFDISGILAEKEGRPPEKERQISEKEKKTIAERMGLLFKNAPEDWKGFSDNYGKYAAQVVENVCRVKLDDGFLKAFQDRCVPKLMDRFRKNEESAGLAVAGVIGIVMISSRDGLDKLAPAMTDKERRDFVKRSLKTVGIDPKVVAGHIDRSKTNPKDVEAFCKAAGISLGKEPTQKKLGPIQRPPKDKDGLER